MKEYKEWLAWQEVLEDVQDILLLREAKQEAENEPSVSLDEVKKRLGLA